MRTPSGAIAQIVTVYAQTREALVMWPDGEFAQFRVCHLRALPGAEQ